MPGTTSRRSRKAIGCIMSVLTLSDPGCGGGADRVAHLGALVPVISPPQGRWARRSLLACPYIIPYPARCPSVGVIPLIRVGATGRKRTRSSDVSTAASVYAKTVGYP